MGGYLAQLGTTTAPRLGWISSGFWGAIVAGFAAGLAVRLLNYLFRRIPQELDHIKTGLLLPLLSLLFVGALMVMAINPPLGVSMPGFPSSWMGCRAAAVWCWARCWAA